MLNKVKLPEKLYTLLESLPVEMVPFIVAANHLGKFATDEDEIKIENYINHRVGKLLIDYQNVSIDNTILHCIRGENHFYHHPMDLSRLLNILAIPEGIYHLELTNIPTTKALDEEAQMGEDSLKHLWQINQQEASDLKAYLKDSFFGQSPVIDDLIKSVSRRSLRQKHSGLRQSYFMIGPSGTGKSHLAGLLADFYKNQSSFGSLTIDMSSVSGSNQQFELVGLTAGYNEAQPGRLTKFIHDNPQGCVVVLDNLDKAHANCQSVLLEAFDTGFLTDKYQPDTDSNENTKKLKDNPVDCRNVIFIITSNANAEFIESSVFQKLVMGSSSIARQTVIDKLSKLTKSDERSTGPVFQADLLSRLAANTVLLFQPLQFDDFMNIARKKYTDVKSQLENAIGCKIHETDLDTCLRAGLYMIGHELNARRVASDEFTDQYFDQALNLLPTDVSNSTITLQNCEGFSESISEGLYGIDDCNVVRELFRKGIFLSFDTTVNITHEKISVTLENPTWKKATRSQDVKEGGMLAMAIPNISFNDIKGHQYAKEKLQEIVKLLKNPSSMDKHDIEPPKGLLLYGEPGTGKTMLAKALANEADLPFLSCTGPDLLLSDSSGQGSRLQAIYKAARHYAPSIVFIDEIDILGDRNRGGYPLAINQLLAEIDGFTGSDELVFTVAATNYPDRLDPAILRSGRIELKIHVPRLDKEARRHFLEKIKALPSAGNLDVESLLDDTSGMTGAEMEQIQRQIGMYLIRNGLTEITTEQAEDLIAVVRYGERTGIHRDEDNRKRVAIHEAGHAIVAMSLKPSRIIERITITSRGNMGGFVKFDEDQRLLMTPQNILNEMAICLGGRCAQLISDPKNGIDEGATNDLEQVSLYAYLACTKFGFDDDIGWISLPNSHHELALTGMQSKVNERVADWINRAKGLAIDVLTKNKALHAELVEMLLKDETLLPTEFESIKSRVEM